MTKEELQILLSLSKDISNSWNDRELFIKLFERIQPIFEFDDVAIHIWENERISHQLVTSEEWAEMSRLPVGDLVPMTFLLSDTPYLEFKSLKDSKFFNVNVWLNDYPDFVDALIIHGLGYVELLVLPLWKNDTVIGAVEFFTKEKNKLHQKNIDLFKAAADQLSLAVLKVLSNYELARQKSDKRSLLSSAGHIPTITDHVDLIQFILGKIKPMFHFSDIGLFLITADGKFHRNYTTEQFPISLITEGVNLNGEESDFTPHQNSPIEWLAERAEKTDAPVIFDFRNLTSAFPHYNSFIASNLQYRSAVSCNLRLKGKTIGVLCINSLEEGFFREKEFSFYQAITDQVSLALQSVMINEQVRERQAEKEILLGISEDISKSRDKGQLFETVSEKIQPLFNFHDMGLFVLLEDGKYHQDLAIDAPAVHSSEWNTSLFEISLGKTLHKDSPVDHIINKVTEANSALIFDNEALYRKFPHYAQFQSSAFRNATYRDCLATTLKVGQQVIGMFCINSLKEGFFKEDQFSLFQAIADQLAVAVSNILANEEIKKSETEKSLQLAITDILASERKWEEKFAQLPELLAPHLPFKILSFSFLMNDMEDDRSFRFIREGDDFKTVDDEGLCEIIGEDKNQFIEYRNTMTSQRSGYYDHESLKELTKNSQIVSKVREAFGINSLLVQNIALNKGNRLLILAFDEANYAYHDEHLTLFNKLDNSFILSLEKLLAYEEILLHKQEKEELLKLSEKLAAIRDRTELYNIINGMLKDLFKYDDIAIAINTEDLTHHWIMVSAVMKETDRQERYITHLTTLIQNDAAYKKVITSSTPQLMDYNNLEKLNLPEEDLKMVRASGINQVVGVALNQGGMPLGGLFMLAKTPVFSKRKFNLYKNTADQIATAVSNILNNEEILKRQEEKEIMLRISQQINQARSRSDIMRLMSDELKNLFGFEFTSLIFHKKGEADYLQWVVNPTNDLKLKEAFQKIQKIRQPVENSFFEQIFKSKKVRQIPTKEISENHPEYPGVELYLEYGLKSFIVVPLLYANHSLGLWIFNSQDEHLLEKLNLSLLENTASQLAIAVSSLLASEEIVQREKIKSLQVGIQNAFNKHKRLSNKLKETIAIFQNVIPFTYISFNIDAFNDEERGLGFEFIEGTTFRTITPTAFFEKTGLSSTTFTELKNKNRIESYKFFNGEEFISLCKENELMSLYHEKFKVNAALIVPLKLPNQGTFNIEFYTRDVHSYRDEHVQLFVKLESSFTLALEKYLAQEEILRLNQQLHQEKQYLEEEINISYNFGELVGESEGIRKVFKKIEQVASTDTTVLITGETGTGKEVIARAIHSSSNRKNKPLVKLNCAALPPQLMESELFGHEKGSFTGATSRRIGKFELANKGTIFLDEIGEMPLELQAKLLRVLQEKEVERIGGNTVIKVDVRIITATNRKLEDEIANNLFRSDLFYRLNVFPVHIPPLRERKDDILPLANHFIGKKSKKTRKEIEGITAESSQRLIAYNWPGNIRELEHVIERALILNRGKMLRINLGEEMSYNISDKNVDNDISQEVPFQIKTIVEVERELIMNTLAFTGGRVRGEAGAAQLLGIKPTTLEARMKKLGIKKNISYRKDLAEN